MMTSIISTLYCFFFTFSLALLFLPFSLSSPLLSHSNPSPSDSSPIITLPIIINTDTLHISHPLSYSPLTTSVEFCTHYHLGDRCVVDVAVRLVKLGAGAIGSRSSGEGGESGKIISHGIDIYLREFARGLFEAGEYRAAKELLEFMLGELSLMRGEDLKSQEGDFSCFSISDDGVANADGTDEKKTNGEILKNGDGNLVDVYSLLAASFHSLDDYRSASSIYDCLVSLSPFDASLLLNWGIALSSGGLLEEGREKLSRGVELLRKMNGGEEVGTMGMLLHEMGMVDYEQGDLESALNCFQQSWEVKRKLVEKGVFPSSIGIDDTLLRMGMTLIEMKEYERAEEVLVEAEQANENNVDIIAKKQEAVLRRNGLILPPPVTTQEPPVQSIIDEKGAVRFVTFASDPTKCELKRLLDSALHQGIQFTVLGAQGNKKSSNDSVGHGADKPARQSRPWRNGDKLRLLRDFAESMPTDTIIVVVDGYDVVLSGTPSEFMSRYRALIGGKEEGDSDKEFIVFQADYTFYAPMNSVSLSARLAREYPTVGEGGGTIFRFLSSGGIMGNAGSLKALVGEVVDRWVGGDEGDAEDGEWWVGSDQSLFIRWLVEDHQNEINRIECPSDEATTTCPTNGQNRSNIKILVDTHQTLFSGNGGRYNRDHEIRQGRLFNNATGSFPVMFHAPGRKRFQKEMGRLKEEGWATNFRDCNKT